jgi:hypothetical protein
MPVECVGLDIMSLLGSLFRPVTHQLVINMIEADR